MTAASSRKTRLALFALAAIVVVAVAAFALWRATSEESLDAELAQVLEETVDAHQEYADVYIGPTGNLEKIQKETGLTIPEGVAVTIHQEFGPFCIEATKTETGEIAHFESRVGKPEPGPCEGRD